jgi:nucleotide-binding universal stress UspA family protein
MKRIVIATDGSDGARQALEQGFALASDAEPTSPSSTFAAVQTRSWARPITRM